MQKPVILNSEQIVDFCVLTDEAWLVLLPLWWSDFEPLLSRHSNGEVSKAVDEDEEKEEAFSQPPLLTFLSLSFSEAQHFG